MKIRIVRGAFANPFELQNFEPLKKSFDISLITSKSPISKQINLPISSLFSPVDLPNFPFKMPILNRLFTDAHQLFGLESEIKGADIVHVAETYYGYTHQAVKAKLNGLVKHVVSTVWEVIPKNNEGIWGRKDYKKLAYENIDKFICVTELARKALLEEGVYDQKIAVIPVGVDISRFKPIKRKRGEEINILCVARLTAEKGIVELVNAFSKNYQKNPRLRLTLVGDGELKKQFLHTPGVKISRVPYSKIHKVYQQADIFCLLSKNTKYWQEQYGMALVEAMSSGLPILTTRTGAIGEVCADAAVYTNLRDPEDTAAKLSDLINQAELRSVLSKRARARAVANFDHLKIAQQIAKLYKEVCR